jgi:hypothetical protein
MVWIKWLGLMLGALVVIALGIATYGSWRWEEGARALLTRLEAARTSLPTQRYDARELDGLPPPVQRFFRAALKDGQPIVAAASVTHVGSMNMSATAEQWKPFISKQRVNAERGGMRVPLDGEVAWMLAEGAKTYWRGTTTALNHEFAK